ncbi:FKBP-type peptidyl-prolyl cis-trans isomerase [Parafilimonas terrae]|uniref:Peptidyl-prolyl cis-trans isomerase n=1 Tax=Parafilimonas terrae TaxID=1465490 RepID=A0A1I5YQV3_9BACT|nr:FKBP-type peptidyl-prolyl cis-trans isomerase [Parafilimonas terrae]SFQ46674.1 FKBP-type peptidyl-prolyl cis-trans isomerase FkpA [Parafilimonas terrae]
MKNLLIIILGVFVFVACKKKNDACMPASAASEADQLAAFCNKYSINYTVDPNGIYYEIVEAGSGASPNLNSIITVAYTASTLDGNVVEDYTNTNNPLTSQLSEFIECWRIALPYIQRGGHIKMVAPSSLAYGCTGLTSENIPANSPLYYDIVLLNVE